MFFFFFFLVELLNMHKVVRVEGRFFMAFLAAPVLTMVVVKRRRRRFPGCPVSRRCLFRADRVVVGVGAAHSGRVSVVAGPLAAVLRALANEVGVGAAPMAFHAGSVPAHRVEAGTFALAAGKRASADRGWRPFEGMGVLALSFALTL